ncbi:MAG: hypothetical protein ABFS56_02150 [Pseudomonadota bacterium]
MDTEITDNFADIIALAQAAFEQVDYVTDATPKRAILRLNAKYGQFRVFVTELFSDGLRKYRYYILYGDWVEAGFDNSPDSRAIRLKYGHIGKEHAGEHIPHLHQEDKTELSLTEEMNFTAFVDWVKANIQPIPH